MARYQPTVRAASLVYGQAGRRLDDPAELFHEASKLYPCSLASQAQGVRLLELHPELRESAARSVKRARPASVPLPEPELPAASLADVIEGRRSERAFAGQPLTLHELSALLHAAYGVTRRPEGAAGERFRSAPSGGALYPLDLYPFVESVAGLGGGAYHYDPLRHALAPLPWMGAPPSLAAAMIAPGLLDGCAVTFVVAGMFWRTRFKYGLRGYRFALIEVGHLAQNLLLACAALGLAALPVGGFYDARLDELLGLDGLNESTLYAVCVGRRPGASA